MSELLQHRKRLLAEKLISPFRGGIAENCKRFQFIGSGYSGIPKEQDGHFQLDSARQCAGPMEALDHPGIRVVHIIGATQVLKSVVGDCFVIWSLEHERKAFIVYFDAEAKADKYCSRRLISTIKNHPILSKDLKEAKKENRYNDMAGNWLKFSGFQVLVCGLNDGNTSTLEWERIWISEAWLHPNDGLLQKAFKRADHFPTTAKVLNESQASEAGTDLHRAVEVATQVPLEWLCPFCFGRQTWEWSHWSFKRPDDFIAKLTVSEIYSTHPDEIKSAISKKSESLRGKYAGMRWPENDQQMTIQDRAAKAYWECVHCGSTIEDKAEIRKAIADTYEQNFIINGKIPREVCFTIPYEAATINSFAKDVEEFLTAKAANEQGNELPLTMWFCAWRGYFYQSSQYSFGDRSPTIGSYDPAEKIPNQHSVNLIIDCQKAIDAGPDEDRMGSFWVIVEGVDKSGNVRQLGRYFCTSKEDVEKIQKRLKIPNARVCVDGGYWQREVLEWAARNYEEVDAAYLGMKYRKRISWLVFIGDDANYYWHGLARGKRIAKAYSEPHPHQVTLLKDGKQINVKVPVFRWSNLAVKDMLSESMVGGPGRPKMEFLSRNLLDEKTRERETGDFTFEKQVSAEYRTSKKGKAFWEKKRPENHFWDCLCMGLARRLMDGFGGSIYMTDAEKS
jgi:hypothetical protein